MEIKQLRIPVKIILQIAANALIRSSNMVIWFLPNPRTSDNAVNKKPAKIELTVIMLKWYVLITEKSTTHIICSANTTIGGKTQIKTKRKNSLFRIAHNSSQR